MGRSTFTKTEADEIRSLLREKDRTDRTGQKRIRGNLRRRFDFYITDFDQGGQGFGATDFDRLIRNGVITITDDTSPPQSPSQPSPISVTTSDHTTDEIVQLFSSPDSATTPTEGESGVPAKPGLYAIYVDSPTSLTDPFRSYLQQRETTLIYVGKASKSLQKRLINQDLRHTSASTFFRGIGSVLGYRPPQGSLKGRSNQNNYKFSDIDTWEIIDWIDTHLTVKTVLLSPDEIENVEPEVIRLLKPLLNTTYNPDALQELANLREECRLIARS